MDGNTTTEGIQWGAILIPVATFILGSFLVPRMEWISNTLKIWVYTFGAGLLLFGILIQPTIRQWLNDRIPINPTWILVCIIVTSLGVWVLLGSIVVVVDKRHEGIDQLKQQTDGLISEISQFVADRALSQPSMPTGNDRAAIDDWFQKSAQYSATTENLFVSRFQQKIMDIGYMYKNQGLFTDEEWRLFRSVNQPQSPVIDWVLTDLKNYRTKLR
jgi:hypothetical protein